jgi:hypothetical protein
MTREDYVAYIRKQLANKSLLYQLGFLQSFLASLMYEDTNIAYKFKARINENRNRS